MRLTTRISLIVLVTVLALLLINMFIVRQQLIGQQQQSQQLFTLALTQSLTDAITQDVILGQSTELSQLLEATQSSNKSVEYMYVVDMRGHLFAHSFQRGFPAFLHRAIKIQPSSGARNNLTLTHKYQVEGHGLIYEYTTPLINGLKASLYIGLNQSEITDAANKATKASFGISILLALFGTLITWLATRYAAKPLIKLLSILKQHKMGEPLNLSKFKPNEPELSQLKSTLTSVFHARDTAEHELKEREQNLSTTLNSIGDGVIATDELGLITRMNPIAEKLTGWTLKDCTGLPISTVFNIIDETTRLPVDNPVEKVLHTGETIYLSNHTTLVSKDGTEYQIADSAAPIRNESGTVLGMVLVFNNVTEQYKLRQKALQAQQHTENLLESMHSLAAILDMDSNVLFFNTPLLTLTNTEMVSVIGQPIWQIPWFTQQSHVTQVLKPFLERLILDSTEQSIDIDLLVGEGSRSFQVHLTPLINEHGQSYQILLEAFDITSRKQAENSLQTSLQQLVLKEQEQREVLNTLGDGIITIDEKGLVISLNKSAEELFGLSSEQLLGQSASTVLASPHQNNFFSRLQNPSSLAEDRLLGTPFEITGFHHKNGEFPMRLNLRTLPNADETGYQFVASCHDLSHEKAQQNQLQRAQKMDALGKLVGGIAHDYNNMLGVILGYADLINIKFPDIDGLQKYTATIAQAGERGKSLTKRLLNFSKRENTTAGDVNITPVLEEQKEIIAKTLTALIQLDYQLCPSPWHIWVDSNELEDCLLNLSINAGHAMQKGGLLSFSTQNISIRSNKASALGLSPGNYLTLMVSDNGCGIDESTIKKIFDPFFSTKGVNGTGLGLSQVYRFMERSGGAIKVQSKLSEGTTFTLYFPQYEGKSEPLIRQNLPVENLQGDGKTILVVDDEPALRDLAEEILSGAGYRVLTAKDGFIALEVLASQAVDCLLSDVIMPHMDGFELAQKVRNTYPSIKIQLASGYSDQRASSRDNPLHSSILYKPYSAAELLGKLAALQH